MIDFEEFLPDLEPELPLCPVPVIERRLREALIEGCEDAAIWRYELPEIRVLKGVDTYNLDVPQDTEVHSVLSFSRGSLALSPTRDLIVDQRGTVRLPMVPAADSRDLDDPDFLLSRKIGLCVGVTLKPSRLGREIGREVYRDHYKLVISGALSKCFAMAGQPWSASDRAAEYRAIFEQEIASARRSRERGYVTGSHTLKGVSYASPRRY